MRARLRELLRDRTRASYTAAIGGALLVFATEQIVADPFVRCVLSDTAWTAVAIAAVVDTARAARRASASDRLTWLFFVAGAAFWLAGQMARNAVEIGTAALPPVWLDLAFLAAAPLWTIGLVCYLRAHGERLALVTLLLDVSAVVLALVAGVTVYLSSALLADVLDDPATSAVAVLYPVMYIAATGAALSAVWGLRGAVLRSPMTSLLLGIALNALAFTLYVPAYIQGRFAAGSLLDPLWIVGMSAIAIAGTRAATDRSRHTAGSTFGIEISRMVVPAAVAALSAFFLVYADRVDIGRYSDVVDGAIAVAVLVLAARAGLALWANWQLGERERRRAEQLEILYEVGLATAREQSLDELASLIAREATALTGTDGAMVSVAEPRSGFVVRAQHNAESLGLRRSVGEALRGIALDTLRTRDVVVASDYARHPDSNPLLRDLIASAIAAPLIQHGEVVGTLTAYARRSRTFTPETVSLVRLYAAQAAIAIANADLLAETRRLARDDDLTGVLNRRSLLERLENEIAEATRHGDIFTVVLSDVDGLKGVNDTAGHLVGNDVLKAVARTMRDSARSEDVVARFGGDEFVLLLPRTAPLPAQALVGRIAARLREEHYMWAGRANPLPRASFGMAWFPEDGRDADALLAVADARMYQDKARAREMRTMAAAEAD
jgi:diguanylate cyclase (GGDEF)-like protein